MGKPKRKFPSPDRGPSRKDLFKHIADLQNRVGALEAVTACVAKRYGELQFGADEFPPKDYDFFTIVRDEETGVVTLAHATTRHPEVEEAPTG